MSNASIIERILTTLDSYELGQVSATDVERALEISFHALEGLTSMQIGQSRDLAYRLVGAHLVDDEMQFKGDEKAIQVLREFRSFLGSLPGTSVIQVSLIDEGTPCWRPVIAEHLGGNRYRILEGAPQDEQWEFMKNEIVECEQRKLSTGEELVAARRIDA